MTQARSVDAAFALVPSSGRGEPPPSGGTTTPTTTPTTTTNPITAPVAATPLDVTGPSLSLLRLTPARIRVARGTTVRYSLSEPARVVFRVGRALVGRRVGSRCEPTTALNRALVRCLRWVRLPGGFSQAGRRGANSRWFAGRLAGRRLAAGRYRVVALSTDRAGNAGVARRAALTVIR
jgi:hypothetical protein